MQAVIMCLSQGWILLGYGQLQKAIGLLSIFKLKMSIV